MRPMRRRATRIAVRIFEMHVNCAVNSTHRIRISFENSQIVLAVDLDW